jgi:hypothetical protein
VLAVTLAGVLAVTGSALDSVGDSGPGGLVTAAAVLCGLAGVAIAAVPARAPVDAGAFGRADGSVPGHPDQPAGGAATTAAGARDAG